MGGSSAPERRGAFALPELGRDLKAVIAAVSPDRPVHLVGHDWGAFQCWEGVTAGGLDGLVASFTAIAGPRIDLSRAWLRSRLRPSPTAVAQLASQLRRSWYVAWFQVPSLPELVLDIAVERAWPAVMRRREGIEPRPGHPAPTLARDVRTGIALYRTNLPILARRTAAPRAEIPVQLIVPTLDRYISTAMYEDAAGWAARIRVREVRAGHWVQRSHPKIVAAYIEEFVAAEPGRH
jgi:pimeloyl-ACP methyl ester carboxylesterase